MPDAKEDELNILFLDDEQDNLDAFTLNCEMYWETTTMKSPWEVIQGKHSVAGYDAVIVDLVFDYPQEFRPDLKIDPSTGLTFVAWMQTHHPEIPVMVLSAYLTTEIIDKIEKEYPKVLCKDKPLDFSKAKFREMMRNFIKKYKETS